MTERMYPHLVVYFTWKGFLENESEDVGLMKQISTYTTDFLVDAIALHDDMHLLHPIFANPAILKVLQFMFSFELK